MATGYPSSLKHLLGSQDPLRFDGNGDFRILHLTDIHEVDPEMDDDENRQIPLDKSRETMNVIEKCIEYAKPNLVVFGGDNISGYWEEFTYEYMEKTILRIIDPIVKRNIPLAVVFGNHDSEREYTLPFLTRDNQIGIYARYGNFRGCYNEEEMYGCGNCSLPVYSYDGTRIAKSIWLIDSNDYERDEEYNIIEDGGYGHIHEDQIKWYENKSEALKKQNNGNIVPSVLFQHIPVIQEWYMTEEVPEGTPGAIGVCGKPSLAKPGIITDGLFRESPCPPNDDFGQFASWKKTGNILAAFFGHDHTNTFTAEYDGIKLIQTLGAGYHSYGKERGGRLIVLHENDNEIETETIVIDRITETEF